ncbi:hypothetical protein GEMRC1_004735 [Eukaryota sp. GEM-RC1]
MTFAESSESVENVNELQMGTAFTYPNALALSNVEVASLFHSRFEKHQKIIEDNPSGSHLPHLFNDAMLYADRFAGVDTHHLSSIQHFRSTLLTRQFDPYEIASLINLQPDTIEEALDLLPSLARFQHFEIDEALTELRNAIS